LVVNKVSLIQYSEIELELKGLLLCDQEWVRLTELILLLEPFEEATTLLSGSNYPTVSLAGVAIHAISRKLADLSTNITSTCVKSCYQKLVLSLINRFTGDWNPIILISTKLDPRFKLLNNFTSSDRSKSTRLLQEEYNKSAKSPPNPAQNPQKKLLDYISFNNLDELQLYESFTVLSMDIDPLQWWRTHQSTFPTLSVLALKYLSVVATSVPSEQLFSKSGEVVTKKRSRLAASTVKEITFLHSNRKWVWQSK